jgi:choline dehydrogenase-like flavoprotein
MTLLEDQQLAGLMMWIPAGVVYVVTALILLGVWLQRLERAEEAETSVSYLGLGTADPMGEAEGAGHVIGTYRMGDDPRTSVVNAEQRSHDHPNLF